MSGVDVSDEIVACLDHCQCPNCGNNKTGAWNIRSAYIPPPHSPGPKVPITAACRKCGHWIKYSDLVAFGVRADDAD